MTKCMIARPVLLRLSCHCHKVRFVMLPWNYAALSPFSVQWLLCVTPSLALRNLCVAHNLHQFTNYTFISHTFLWWKGNFLLPGVQQSRADQYLELVRRVGMELRALLSSVDTLVPVFPVLAHREVCTSFTLDSERFWWWCITLRITGFLWTLSIVQYSEN
jgi:hypothetical protein